MPAKSLPMSLSTIVFTSKGYTVKPVLKGHSIIDKYKILKFLIPNTFDLP